MIVGDAILAREPEDDDGGAQRRHALEFGGMPLVALGVGTSKLRTEDGDVDGWARRLGHDDEGVVLLTGEVFNGREPHEGMRVSEEHDSA